MNTSTVSIYTDGSCIGNPGPGGWAYVVISDDKCKYVDGDYEFNTTNNRMELTAVIRAINAYVADCDVIKIYTDSNLVVKCGTGAWKQKSNLDLWADFNRLSKMCKVELVWVKAHANNVFNNMVDRIAHDHAKRAKKLSSSR